MSHLRTMWSMSEFIAVQYIVSRARRFHFCIPRCLSCDNHSISGLMDDGITMRCPLGSLVFSFRPNISSATTFSSSTKVTYGFGHRWLSSWTNLMTPLRTSSGAVSWAISCHLISDTGILDFTQHTWTSTSASVLLKGVL